MLRAPDEQNLRLIRGDAPLAALLRNHLSGVHAGAGDMSLDEAETIVRPTIELAAAALNAAVTEENAAAVQLALTGQIARYIDERILDPSLTGEALAATFGISTRKLYCLFEAHGGVASYITRGRLQQARQMLADPAQQSRSIADIAELHGFAYRTNFVRAFRKLFGVTPREVRAHAAEGRRLLEHPGDDTTMWHWIRQLKGSGTVTVSNGATVESQTLVVGFEPTGFGQVTLTGPGTSWTTTASTDMRPVHSAGCGYARAGRARSQTGGHTGQARRGKDVYVYEPGDMSRGMWQLHLRHALTPHKVPAARRDIFGEPLLWSACPSQARSGSA